MVTKIQKWGNSHGLRISKEILEQAEIEPGDSVQVSVRNGQIVVKPAIKIRGKHDLKKLLAKVPKNYRSVEMDWGLPVGQEAW